MENLGIEAALWTEAPKTPVTDEAVSTPEATQAQPEPTTEIPVEAPVEKPTEEIKEEPVVEQPKETQSEEVITKEKEEIIEKKEETDGESK